MRIHGNARFVAGPLLLCALFTLGAGAALHGQDPDPRQTAPAEPEWAERFTDVPVEDFLTHAREVDERGLFEDVKWLTDEVLLVYRAVDELRVGPRARIQPRMGTHLLDEGDSAAVILTAKIETEKAVRSLGLAEGITWKYTVPDPEAKVLLKTLLVPDYPDEFLATMDEVVIYECGVVTVPHAVDASAPHAEWELIDPGARGWTYADHEFCRMGCCRKLQGSCLPTLISSVTGSK